MLTPTCRSSLRRVACTMSSKYSRDRVVDPDLPHPLLKPEDVLGRQDRAERLDRLAVAMAGEAPCAPRSGSDIPSAAGS